MSKNKTISQETLRDGLDTLIRCTFLIACDNGWHDKEPSDGEYIALMHSELSEALEVLRGDENPPDKYCPEFLALEVELADVVLRVFDYAAAKKLRLSGAMLAKMQFNRTRGYRHGGKRF